MALFDRIDRHPSRRTLLGFGATLLGGSAVYAAVARFVLHRETAALAVLATGAVIFGLSFVPAVGRRLYIAWMAFGLVLRSITSPIVLLILYVACVVPLGLLFRLVRRDTMRRELDPAAASYWEDRGGQERAASYLRQY